MRIARLLLDAGEYELFLDEKKLGDVHLNGGDKKFFAVRTAR